MSPAGVDLPPEPPSAASQLTVMDEEARASAHEAASVFQRLVTKVAGSLGKTRRRVSKTKGGAQATVTPSDFRYPMADRGTGIHGPARRPIRPHDRKALRFDGRFAMSSRGMAARDFTARIEDAAREPVEQAAVDGAERARARIEGML